LRQWRQEIDQLDDQLLQILHRRLMLSEKLGALKRDQQISIFQPERWKFILEEMHRKGTALGIHPDFIRNLFIQIHDESIRIQGEVINNPGTKVS
jgi:chorismate mutase